MLLSCEVAALPDVATPMLLHCHIKALPFHSRFISFHSHSSQVREELEQLLDDDDMAEMFLTHKAAAPPSPTAGSLSVPPLSFGQPSVLQAGPLAAVAQAAAGRGAGTVLTSGVSTAQSDDEDIEELEQLLEVRLEQLLEVRLVRAVVWGRLSYTPGEWTMSSSASQMMMPTAGDNSNGGDGGRD